MPKKAIIIFVTCFVFITLILFFITLANRQQKAKTNTVIVPSPQITSSTFTFPTNYPTPSQQPTTNTPEEVTRNFYSWYIFYPGDPLSTGAYKSSAFLSDNYKQSIAGLEAISHAASYDPILCPQDKSNSIYVVAPVYNSNHTQATTTILWGNSDGKEAYRVKLIKVQNSWVINDIFCL